MSSLPWFRTVLSATLLSFTVAAPLGCAGAPEAEETVDSDSDALHASWQCDVGQLGTARCQSAIADIQAQAAAAGRDAIVARGIDWLDRGITYDTNKSFQGYRRDCSGFVSMTWSFTANPNTAWFPPFVTGKYAVPLGSLDDLAPGDALNKTFRNPVGHVMLFGGWASADHSELYLLHEYSTGKPAALIQVSRGDLGDFIPIRSVTAPAPTTGVAAPPPPATPPASAPPAGCGALAPGQSLGADQGATSCDGRFTLVQQSDGNLVLYQSGAGALWSSGTYGSGGRVAVMQGDGNLVVYTTDGKALWSSQTSGHPGASLAIQDDGNLVIYDGKAIWDSHTSGH